MTDLIKCLKEKKENWSFPISEKPWIDIGQLEEYRKAIKNLEI